MSARPSLPTKTAESIRAMDGDALVPSPPSPSIESSIASTSSTSTSTLTSTSSSRRNRSDVVSIHRVPSADDALDDTNLSENSVFVSVKFAEAASAVRLGVPARVNCGVLKALAMQHFRSAALIPTLASNNDADYGLYNSAAPNKAHNARLAEERALALVADAAFVIREEIALRISVPEVAQSLRLPPLLWPLDEPLAQVQSVALARTELGDSSQFFGLYCNSVIVGDNDNRGDFEQIDGKRTARSYAWSRAAGVALVLRREAPIDVVLPNGDKLNKSLALGEPPLTLLKQIDEHWAAHIKPRTLPRKSRKDGSGTSMVASPPTSPRMTRDEAAAPQRFAFYGTTSVAVSSRVAEREPLPLTTDVTKRQTWYYCREIVLTAHVPTLGMKTLVPLHADMRVSDAIPQLLKRMHISVDPSTMALYRTHKCDEAFAEDATLAACQFDSGGNVYLRQKVKLNLLSSPSSARRQKPNRDRRVSLLPRAAMQNSTRALWTMPGDERIVSVLSKAALDDGAVPEQRRIVSEKETTLRRHLETASRDACARLLVTARVSAQLPRVVLAQSVVRGWLARRAVAEMRAREAKRKQVAVELRDTERSYVTGIKLLVSAYKVPLEHQLEHGEQAVGAGAPIVTRQHIDKLFLNIEDICEQTDKLLYALEGRMQRFQVATRVGDIFVQLVPSLALYSVYNAGYPESQSTYRSLSSNRKFAAFMDAQRMLAADQSKLDFISLSIMPIQRVPRYRMLLGELHKYTAPDHPDYAPLASALRDVAKLADDINESIRAAESDEHVRQLQRKLVGLDFPLLQPGRVFVREGVLDKVCKKDVKPRHFYLFNDMLLYANDTMGQLRLSKVFPIAEGLSIGESTRERAFQIITPKKSFLVIAADNHKRADWIRALQSVVKRDAARKADAERLAKAAAAAVAAAAADSDDDDDDDAVDSVAAPVWVADKERANCMLCHRRFTKLTTRRHHCRGCGKLVCHKCSDHRVPLANIGKNCRVCDKCFVRYDANSSVVRDSQSVALFDVESDSSRGWVVPSGALECVLPWLASAADVCACACVSRAWAMAVAESDDVWRTLYKKAYERFALPAAPPTGTWREALRIKRRYESSWRDGVGRSEWLLGHTAAVMCLTNVATSYMASGSADGAVRLWDLSADAEERNRCVATLESAHGGGVLCLTAADGGTRAAAQLCSGGIDRVLRQWDADTGVCVREFEGHSGAVTHLDSGRRWLVSAAQDGEVRLWDPRIGDQRQCCVQQFCRPGSGRIVALRNVNDSTVLTASGDSVVRLWDSAMGKCVQQWDASRFGTLLDVLVDSTFTHAFVVPQQPDAGIVSLDAAAGVTLLPPPPLHRGRELTAAARDATKLVTASGADGGIVIMQGERNAFGSWRSVVATSANPEADSEHGRPGPSLCLCITDIQLATGHANGAIRVFQMNAG